MTACAMTVGMVPMALALEKGSQMQAPLGRAVIGGLVMSTFATLLVVPSIFALVIGKKVSESASIYPDDPESPNYDPNVYAEAEATGRPRGPARAGRIRMAAENRSTPDAPAMRPAESADRMRRDESPALEKPDAS